MANKKVKIELTAVNKTKAAFSKVTSGLKTVGGAAGSAAKGIAGVGLAAAATATALAVIINKSFEYIDTLDKTSRRTGIATDTLQAFQLAAIESGSSVEQAQKGLEKFSRSIGDAASGLKTQADIFKDLGISLRDSLGQMRDPTQILFEVAEGLKNLGSEAERSRVLANLFGRAGMQMSEVFRDGAEGLERFNERARQLGIILPDQVIKNVAKFNDQFSVLKLQVKAVGNNISGALVPAFSLVVGELTNMLTSTNEAEEGFDSLGKRMALSIMQGVKFSVLAVQDMFRELEHQFLTFATSGIGQFLFDFDLDPIQQMQVELINAERQVAKIQKKLDLNLQPLGMFPTKQTTDDDLARAEEAATKIRTILGGMIPTEENSVLTFLDDMIAAVKSGGDDWETLGVKGLNSISNLLNPLEAFDNKLKEVNKSVGTAIVSSMKKFEDTIMSGLKNGKFAFEDFASFVVEQLLRIAIQQMIIAPMTSSLSAMLPGFDGGGYTGMGSRAGGVDGKGGFPAILHPNETVVDHTKGQGTGGGANITFNIQANDAAGFDQLLNSRKQMITAMINNAMNNRGKMGVV